MLRRVERGLRSIQESSDATKIRWLVIAAAGTMIVIVGFWLLTLGMEIPRADEGAQAEDSGEFLKIAKNGSGIAGRGIMSALGNAAWSLRELIQALSEHTVVIEK